MLYALLVRRKQLILGGRDHAISGSKKKTRLNTSQINSNSSWTFYTIIAAAHWTVLSAPNIYINDLLWVNQKFAACCIQLCSEKTNYSLLLKAFHKMRGDKDKCTITFSCSFLYPMCTTLDYRIDIKVKMHGIPYYRISTAAAQCN